MVCGALRPGRQKGNARPGLGSHAREQRLTSRVRTFWERESKGDQVVLGQGALSFFLFSGHSELPMPVLCADPNTQRKSYP